MVPGSTNSRRWKYVVSVNIGRIYVGTQSDAGVSILDLEGVVATQKDVVCWPGEERRIRGRKIVYSYSFVVRK